MRDCHSQVARLLGFSILNVIKASTLSIRKSGDPDVTVIALMAYTVHDCSRKRPDDRHVDRKGMFGKFGFRHNRQQHFFADHHLTRTDFTRTDF